jgi:hypothetical protein
LAVHGPDIKALDLKNSIPREIKESQRRTDLRCYDNKRALVASAVTPINVASAVTPMKRSVGGHADKT